MKYIWNGHPNNIFSKMLLNYNVDYTEFQFTFKFFYDFLSRATGKGEDATQKVLS